MSRVRSYLRGVVAPELHAQYLTRASLADTELMRLQADALRWYADTIDCATEAERVRLVLRAPRSAQLVDVRVTPELAQRVKLSAARLGVSARQWVYSSLTLYALRSFD